MCHHHDDGADDAAAFRSFGKRAPATAPPRCMALSVAPAPIEEKWPRARFARRAWGTVSVAPNQSTCWSGAVAAKKP